MAQTIIKEKDNYFEILLTGSYTGGLETDELRGLLKKIAAGDKNKVVINLLEVEFLASPALGVFLSANAHFQGNGGRMILLNPNTYLADMFKFTRLSDVVTVSYSIKDAKDELGLA
jgi:anti-anti-sigma factor